MTTTILSDTFTDDDGPLTGHTPDTSLVGTGVWTDWAASGSIVAGSAQISGNKVIIADDNCGALVNCGWSRQQTFSVDWTPAVGEDNRSMFIFRARHATGYYRLLMREPNGDIRLHSSSGDTLIASDSFAWTEGTTYTISVECDKGDVSVKVDGVEVLSATGLDWSEDRDKCGLARATGSSLTEFDNLTVTTSDQFAKIRSGDSDDLVPQNQNSYYDGERYWVFSTSSGSLTCHYGSNPWKLTETDVAAGGGTLANINNSGKCYAIIFGTLGGTKYAWAAISTTDAGGGWEWYRWELTSSGLGTPTVVSVGDSATPEQMGIGRNRGSSVSRLYGVRGDFGLDFDTRYIDADMTGESASGVPFDPSGDYPETCMWYDVSDGYVMFHHGDNESPAAVERRKDNIGDNWGSEVDVGGEGVGEFEDVKRATNFSHQGQHVQIRTNNGRIYAAYIDDEDSINGHYGNVVVRWREDSQTGSWTTVSTDAAGEHAIGITLSTDGTDLILNWIPAPSGTVGTTVKMSIYDVSGGTWSAAETVWAMESTEPRRIVAPYYVDNLVATVTVQDETDDLWLAWSDLPAVTGNRRRRFLIAAGA